MAYNQRANSIQATYNPLDYTFQWVGDWYAYDSVAGKKIAMAKRREEMERLKAEGWTVKPFSLANQLVQRGGIGSGHPHIELVINVYGFNAYREGMGN